MTELIDIWRVIELLSDKRCDCNFFVDGQTAYEALSDMIKAVKELPRIDLVKCEECEWSNGECSVGERYQGGCTFGERRAEE